MTNIRSGSRGGDIEEELPEISRIFLHEDFWLFLYLQYLSKYRIRLLNVFADLSEGWFYVLWLILERTYAAFVHGYNLPGRMLVRIHWFPHFLVWKGNWSYVQYLIHYSSSLFTLQTKLKYWQIVRNLQGLGSLLFILLNLKLKKRMQNEEVKKEENYKGKSTDEEAENVSSKFSSVPLFTILNDLKWFWMILNNLK